MSRPVSGNKTLEHMISDLISQIGIVSQDVKNITENIDV
jgi:hypothetical protein